MPRSTLEPIDASPLPPSPGRLTLFSLLDETSVGHAALLRQITSVLCLLRRETDLHLALLPPCSLDQITPTFLAPASEILIVPWSALLPLHKRASGRQILARVCDNPSLSWTTVERPRAPLTRFFSLSGQGAWTCNDEILQRQLADAPGWDQIMTIGTQGDQRIAVLRQPEAPGTRSMSHQMAPIETPLYLAYLISLLQRIVRERQWLFSTPTPETTQNTTIVTHK